MDTPQGGTVPNSQVRVRLPIRPGRVPPVLSSPRSYFRIFIGLGLFSLIFIGVICIIVGIQLTQNPQMGREIMQNQGGLKEVSGKTSTMNPNHESTTEPLNLTGNEDTLSSLTKLPSTTEIQHFGVNSGEELPLFAQNLPIQNSTKKHKVLANPSVTTTKHPVSLMKEAGIPTDFLRVTECLKQPQFFKATLIAQNQTFIGFGGKKKEAKKMAHAFAVEKLLNQPFPEKPELQPLEEKCDGN